MEGDSTVGGEVVASWLERLFPLVALPVVVACAAPLGAAGDPAFWAPVLGFLALLGLLTIPAWTNRVVAGPAGVRVRYVTTELEVPRDAIVAIRPGGRGTSIELAAPVATDRGEVGPRVPVPSSLRIGWRRVADALGVPRDQSRVEVRPVFRWLAAAIPFLLVAIVVVGSTQRADDGSRPADDDAVLVSGETAAEGPEVEVAPFLVGVGASALLAGGALLLDRRRRSTARTDGQVDGYDGPTLPPVGHSLPIE